MAFTQITNISYLVMKQQGCGKFVAISSIGGIRGAENDSGYSASKSYIIKYIEGMARKSNKEGKHVSFLTVLPGFVDTQMAQGDHFFLDVHSSNSSTTNHMWNSIRETLSLCY